VSSVDYHVALLPVFNITGKPGITPFVVDLHVTFHQRLSVWPRYRTLYGFMLIERMNQLF
jgi:hypothetical protein